MTRTLWTLTLTLLAAVPARAAEPPLSAEERILLAETVQLNRKGEALYLRGQAAAAVEEMQKALEIHRRLFPPATRPSGHPEPWRHTRWASRRRPCRCCGRCWR